MSSWGNIRNRSEDLRPVGIRVMHEVLHEASWASSSTEVGPIWWEYEVTGHILTPSWGCAEWYWQEQWQPIGRVYEPVPLPAGKE